MNLPRISINRPVTTLMVFLGVILLGFISWSRLPQELFPPINYPQITVMTSYEGAAPEEIETLITKIIEEAVGTVNNVKRISSTSKEGLSLVMIEFNWGTNMDFASLSVREKIDLIKERLPREAKEPLVMKYNPFDLPIMTVSVTGDKPPLELRRISKKVIKDELEKIEGVASVEITGGLEREIMVEVDQPRLQASGLSILDIVNNLRLANINYPAGTIKESFYEYLIRTMGEFQAISEIKDVVTSVDEPEQPKRYLTPEEEEEMEKKARRLIYLRDIARIKDTTKEKTSVSRYNGKENISLSMRKQSGANTVLVAQGARKAIFTLKKELPGISLEIVYDQSKFISSSIASVRDAAIQGGILAFLVLLLFLGRMGPALNISLAIPISLMTVFSLMFLVRLSLNTISLGGLALGVGMLVDNAIVVLESISLKRGSKKEAVIEGTNEVVGAITGSTLTTVAVFLPTIFVIGIAGQLFKELAFTITFSLLASLVMALSLIPVFATVMGSSSAPIDFSRFKFLSGPIKRYSGAVTNLKENYLNFASFLFIKNKRYLLTGVSILFIISLILLFTTDRILLPTMDQRQFVLKVEKKPGTTLEETDRVIKEIEKLLFGSPEVKNVTVNIGSSKDRPQEEILETLGSHQAQILVNLKNKKEMENSPFHSTNEVLQSLKAQLADKERRENMSVEYLAQESVLKTAFGEQAPVVLEVKGSDLNRVSTVGEDLKKELEKIRGLYGVKTSLVEPSPETKVNIIKDRASLYNLSVRDIALTAQTAIKGYVATKFKEKKEGDEVDVRVRLRESDRVDFTNLRNILVYSPLRNAQVPLSELAYLTRGLGPTQIKRLDQQRAVVVSANIFKRNFNPIRQEIDSLIKRIHIQRGSSDFTITFGGQTQAMKESFNSLRFALILSIILVYMIMAGEFESLWQPFVIMFTLPLSLIGAAFALKITFTSLSVVVMLGMIMLGGIVVNNGIVLIDYVNLLRKEGKSTEEALLSASFRRLRPILMTSLTTILGLVPLALGVGEGSELMSPLAITVIGGLTSAAFLTLIVIPAIYLVFEKLFSHPIFGFKFRLAPAEVKEEIPIVPPAVSLSEAPEVAPVEQPAELLNERQIKTLELLKEKERISRIEYAQLFGISIPTAARDLKELVDKGYIVAHGPLGPGRYYVLKK